ncbi:type 1 glutamine amidotransferase [Albimonas pacifica]|uniref:GMP synthase (Glutamine-hydrolysing) n=1 Tax=Albimonas pacifica TaxID=1114924 RepID=A0A1I3I1C5_9RHOB|nr:type 1 glutamine amidotransferase [Albimonas pacifica]SFI41815.1 GMP synthase (glutamine-hydrolysing) [Albimonas pacifica]
MRIGILETGFPPRELQDAHGTYPDMFARLLAGHGFAFRAWPVLKDEFPAGPQEADGWLITGSRFGVYEDEPWIARSMDLVREIAAAKLPMVGICFGHQLMAQALGGHVEKSDRGWGLGPVDYRDLEIGEPMRIIAVHQDQVTTQPPATRIIAQTDHCPIAGLAWTETPAISWQPHPEMSPAFTSQLIEMRRGATYDDALADAALSRMSEPLTSPALGARIARFFKENAKVDA